MMSRDAIERLLDAAFGADRHGRTAYLIRDGMPWLPELPFGIEDEKGRLIGSLQSWPVALADGNGCQTTQTMVGHVAVAHPVQGTGHGRTLVDACGAAPRAP